MNLKLTIYLLLAPLLAASPIINKGEHFSELIIESGDQQIQYTIENNPANMALNANNAFWDKGSFSALGKKPAPAHERHLISAHFDSITPSKNGTIRWHLWVSKKGSIEVSPQISGFNKQQWKIKIAEQTREVETSNSPLAFFIPVAGVYICELTYIGNAPSQSKVAGLKITGELAAETSVVRTRWRPSAVHGTFSSSTCPSTKLWVFETQNACDHSNYSPMTTAFGYYGSTFNADRTASGGMNFSMWAASAKATEIPAIAQTPHLLATGSPEATFSGFGHEGSGVKIRDFIAFPHNPKSVIQALRLEIKNGYNVYYGYFYDEPKSQWRLYAMGRKPVRTRRPINSLRCTSFCEIPGPPQVERTGDQARLIRRRGWLLGEDKQWHTVDKLTCSVKNEIFTSKQVGIDKDGWLTMGTGGVENYPAVSSFTNKNPSKILPPYLAKDKEGQLFQLPAGIGETSAGMITNNSVKIEYEIKDAGTEATAILYYDTKDCLSFIARKLHGTERNGVSNKMYGKDRTWQNSTTSQKINNGSNVFTLKDLSPKTKYFYRLYVLNKEGQTWSEESGSFTTL